jgi:outer membrane receptor protein involved in Fe transport
MRLGSASAVVAGLFFTGVAVAQTPPGGSAVSSEELKEVTVTGSRVITNGNDSPTPVTVIPVEEMMALQPTTVTEAVNLMPALQGSQNVTSRPGGGQRDGAGAYFNLRNMGDLRTLVLYDGMRLIPTINQNQADTNSQIVPQMLLKRVDVVTGGVSAVYGSDAISGVVNFITDRDFNGIKAQVTDGVSNYSDDRTFDIGVAAGTRFAGGRGHVEVSYQRHNDDGIVNRGDQKRQFFLNNTGAGGNGTTVPYFNFDNYYNSNTSFAGLATSGVLSGLVFNPDGSVRAFQHGMIPTFYGLLPFGTAGATAVPANVESGGDGAYNKAATLKAAIGFNQAFGRLDYDFTDSLHGYAQVSYSNIHSFNNFQSPQIAGLRISYANPFLASVQAPYAAQIATQAATPANQFLFSRFLLNVPRADQQTESHMAYFGLDGTVFGKYKWTFNYGNSESQVKAGNTMNIDNGRLFAATDAVVSNGQTVCRAALTNANYAGCVPLNLFGDGRASQAALDYLYQPTYSINRTRMDDINASIVGAPFKTWAGPFNVALSTEWYKQRWDTRSNASPQEFADCSGIQTAFAAAARNCVQGTTARWFQNVMGPLDTVTLTVKELAAEFNAPLLRDVSLAKALDFTGAVRFTNYSTSGNVTTWKAGLDWKLNDSVKLRATRSRDVRAPNLFDLFSPIQKNPGFNVTDSLTNTQYTNLTNVQTANSGLTPEKADTVTAGVVLTPTEVPDLSFSADYYRIKVRDVIFLVQGFQQATVTYCNSIKGAAALCNSVVRNNWTDTNPATNPIQNFLSTYYNISTQDTWGIDTEIAYKFKIADRPFRTRLLASYQPKLQYDFGPLGGGIREIAGAYNAGTNRVAAAPKWKLTGIFTYEPIPSLAVTVLERWRSTLRATYDPNVLLQTPELPSLAYTTLNIAYTRDTKLGNMNLFLNVTNLFNKFPTVYYIGGNGNTQGLPEGDDPIGRYYTLGLRFKL